MPGPEGPPLAVMIPVFNEERTVAQMLAQVLARPEVAEVVVVDDCSEDGTWAIVSGVAEADPRVRVFRQPANQGKGAALKVAVANLSAPFAVVQDADLEYDPEDYPRLLRPLLEGKTDAVFGTRGFAGHTAYSYWFVKGNQWLTTSCNVLFDCYLSDLLTGYKALRTDLWRRLAWTDSGFSADAEIAGRILRLGYRIHEVPIEYVTRSREEGKKVRAADGFSHLWALIRVRFAPKSRLFAPDDAYHRERQSAIAHARTRRDVSTGSPA